MGLGVPLFAAHRITGSSTSCRQARRFTVSTLNQWGTPFDTDQAVSVVSELVGNAVVHGLSQAPDTEGWLGLTVSAQALTCAVSDPSPVAPVACTGASPGERGNGLRIISALSEQWGVHNRDNGAGKIVWARLER